MPNQSISHFYPPDDNYQPHPTNPTLRTPKSLTDLCIDTICRSLPNLEGGLPPNLPQDIVDRIVQSLTSHAALNSTTLRALSQCELSSLNLANCRGVSDDWLIPLSCRSMSSDNPNRKSLALSSDGDGMKQRLRSASTNDCPKNANSFSHGGYLGPPLRNIHPTQFVVPFNHSSSFLDVGSSSSMMMDLDDYDDFNSCDHSSSILQPIPFPSRTHQEKEGQSSNNMEDCCAKSFGSRSTSSFVSASSTPYVGGGDVRPPSPLLPGVLPPPESFSLKWSPTPSSSLWLYPMRGAALADGNNKAMLILPLASQKPLHPASSISVRNGTGDGDNSLYNDEMSYNDPYPAVSTPTSGTTSTLTLLDLRGSQRLTDRGLLQLSHTPLLSLEVVRLDNCHGISGRGLLAFSRSHRLHTLSLANCRRLTDEAAVNVSHLGTSLMALNLGGCRCLTDRSLEALANLMELRKLDLSQVSFNCLYEL